MKFMPEWDRLHDRDTTPGGDMSSVKKSLRRLLLLALLCAYAAYVYLAAAKLARKQVGLSAKQERRESFSLPSVSICGITRSQEMSGHNFTTGVHVPINSM